MQKEKFILSIPETAESLSLSRSTIYRLIHDGAIEAITVRGKIRIRTIAIQRFLDNQQRISRERSVNFS